MAVQDIPPAIQEKLRQLEILRQEINLLTAQKEQISLDLRDTNSAIKTLETLDATEEIYKSVGRIMVKMAAGSVLEELKDRKETLDLRKTTIDKQESRKKKLFEEKQKSLTENVENLSQFS